MGLFLIGTDPEFFLTDKKNNLVSAVSHINGTKRKQLKVERGGLQHDNVAAEFSCDPSESEDQFVETVGVVLNQLAQHVKPLRANVIQSAIFPEEALVEMEAREFGCDPDYDAYDVMVNDMNLHQVDANLRSCGGHVHIGVKDGIPKVLSEGDPTIDAEPEIKEAFGKIRLVKSLDLFVGIPSVIIDSDKAASVRRNLYGKAGSHRPKDYGVEYRTLSNFWLETPELVRLIYRLSSISAASCDTGYDRECLESIGAGDVSEGEQIVRNTINNDDVDMAHDILNKHIVCKMKPETKELLDKALSNETRNFYKAWSITI